jgi:MFS family permease
MKKIYLGILLILMMFGHNFVLNQTQTMQKELTSIFHISITQFNLLYSIPSAISILFIIPMGFFYDKYTNSLLWAGAITLSLGQLFITIFGAEKKENYFELLMTGRVFEGIGA